MTGPSEAEVAAARAVLAAAQDAPLPALPRVALWVNQLVGVQATADNLAQIRAELLPDARVQNDGSLGWRRADGYACDLAPGDVLVQLPSGPWTVYREELALIWSFSTAAAHDTSTEAPA